MTSTLARPGWVPLGAELADLEEADGEPDDGGLVQLGRDGARQRQHLGQLVEFVVLLASPGPRRVPGLLLPDLQDTAEQKVHNQSLGNITQ